MKKHVLAGLLVLFCTLASFADSNDLKTVAEASDFTKTMTNQQVLDYCQKLAAISPKVVFGTIGKTDGGRTIPLLIVGDPVPTSPAELVRDERLVVYIQANIHPGEVEGKEASLMLARDLAEGKYPEILKNTVVLVVPNYNADGSAVLDPENRYYQAGPEAVGKRQNARNLDLNRDWIKLEANETKNVITEILNKWDPVLIIDCHTTDGSMHKEQMTWSAQTHPSGDQKVLDYTRTVLIPAAAKLTKEKYEIDSIPYGNFMDREDRTKGWATFGYQGRYTTNYTGLRNRLSLLLESYVYATYKERVMATYGFLEGSLKHIAENHETVNGLIEAADKEAYDRAENLSPEEDTLALEVEWAAFPGEVVTIQTWEDNEMYQDEQGRRRRRPIGNEITLEIPYFGLFSVKRTASLPHYYVVDGFEAEVIEKLQLHGITLEKLEEEKTVSALRFYPTEMTHGNRNNQGHLLTQLTGEWKEEEISLAKGSILVSTAQPLGMLAAYLLEPECDDGLTAWNYFDHRLTAQWGGRFMPHPVLKLTGKPELPTTLIK